MFLTNFEKTTLISTLLLGLTACGGGSVFVDELKSSDLEKHVFISKAAADHGHDAMIFDQPTSGYHAAPHLLENFTWIVSDEGLLQIDGVGTGGHANFELDSIADNKYTFSVTDSDGTEIAELYRGKPFALSDLDGKIFSTTINYSSTYTACPSTLKVDGATASLKMNCAADTQVTVPFELRQDATLKNAVVVFRSVDDDEGEREEQRQMTLIEGDIDGTSTIAIVEYVDGNYNDDDDDSIEIKDYTKVETEAF